ncbi:hypothetical protein R1sor_004996 [Riccia sorocarpa]|uniref:Uncharacterized protein n=1 Tax=Riccia sorocarpa TaxID=122646 RepID=A0ABD3HM29_9MARC
MEGILELEDMEKEMKAARSPPIDIAETTPSANRDTVEALLDAGYAVVMEGYNKNFEDGKKGEFPEYIDMFAMRVEGENWRELAPHFTEKWGATVERGTKLQGHGSGHG